MSWTCFLTDNYSDPRSRTAGAMWPYAQNGESPGYLLRLPNGRLWNVTGKSTNGSKWTVTGDAPNLTARPSIHCPTDEIGVGYHGWLTDGELSDDLEGRNYE